MVTMIEKQAALRRVARSSMSLPAKARAIRTIISWRITPSKEDVAPPITSVSKPSMIDKPREFTPQEYLQEISEVKREAGLGYSAYQTMVEGIDPKEWYKYEGRLIPGVALKTKLEATYGKQYKEQEQQLQKAWVQARDIPKGTVITKTPTGYTFVSPDTRLEWTKGEFKKIEKAYKIHPLLGGVAEFGFGAISGFAALGKPAAEMVARARGVKVRPVHYVSPFDVAFEPIGWSPKGSTEMLKSRPIFTAGGIASEYLQAVAMAQVLKPVKIGAKIGVKAFIRKTPAVYAKFTRVFPEEKLISGIGKKIGTTPVGRTMYRWGALGYRKGLKLTSAGVKTPLDKTIQRASSELRKVGQKTVYGRGVVKKVWLSPTEFVKAQKDIAAKLARKGVEYGVRTDIRAGVGTARELLEKTRYRLGWTGKRLVKKYKYTAETWRVGKEIPPLYKTRRVGMKGGFERFALEGAKEPIISRGWYQAVKEMYIKGYTRAIPMETGYLLDVSKGFGTAGVRPMAKRWITRYRTPFLKNIQAQVSGSLQQLKTTLKPIKPEILFGRAGVVKGLGEVVIPGSMYKPLYETGLEVGLYGLVKATTAKKRIYAPDLIMVQRTERIPAFKMGFAQMLDAITIPAQKQIQALAVATVTIPKPFTETVSIAKVPTPQPSLFPSIVTAPSPAFPLFLPRIKLFGRGRVGDEFNLFGKIKGLRIADIWSPLGIKI